MQNDGKGPNLLSYAGAALAASQSMFIEAVHCFRVSVARVLVFLFVLGKFRKELKRLEKMGKVWKKHCQNENIQNKWKSLENMEKGLETMQTQYKKLERHGNSLEKMKMLEKSFIVFRVEIQFWAHAGPILDLYWKKWTMLASSWIYIVHGTI